jgi:RNA polymerase sigma-70 factor (ECF subfamily)
MIENTRSAKWKKELEENYLAAYDEYSDALFRHVMLRVRDREAAIDLVQETFSRAWLYLSQGKEIEYMRAFLYRVANNLIVDGSRKKKSSSLDKLMEEDGFEVRDEMAKDPAEVPQAREAMAMLTSLEEIYRTAITMRFIDELTPKEIAQKLGVSENVVSVRIHRGIARLTKMMDRPKVEAA